ncbi:MAG: hypothetical protein ACXAD7_09015 [Candidatus Kariarchaeaceae archaeon]|jgi:hypothetical protein
MSFGRSDYSGELRKILEERFSLENKIERYTAIFSSKVLQYKQAFDLNSEDVSYVLYISDYILTGTEFLGLDEEERLNGLFKSLIFGRDKANISIKEQLTLIELLQQMNLAVKRHFQYQWDRGFPVSVIYAQIISSWLRDFYNMMLDFIPQCDIRWVIAQMEAIHRKMFPDELYRNILEIFSISKLEEKYLYLVAEMTLKRIDLEIPDDEELISKTAYQTQTQHTSAFLAIKGPNGIHYGTTNLSDQKILEINPTIENIFSSIPGIGSENGQTTMSYYGGKLLRMPMGSENKLFAVYEQDNDLEILILIISSSIEDVNHLYVQKLLKEYLIDFRGLPDTLEHSQLLESWVERIHTSQTVEGSEVFGLPHDVVREKDWVFGSVTNCHRKTGTDNADLYLKKVENIKIKQFINDYSQFNDHLLQLLTYLTSIEGEVTIYPFEMYFEGSNDDAVLSLIEETKQKYSLINLQSLFPQSIRYVHRKKQIVKRKYTRLKLRNLLSRRPENLELWANEHMAFKDLSHDYVNIHDTIEFAQHLVIPVKEEPVLVSVSSRLQQLEEKKNKQLELQENIFMFLIQSLQYYVELAIINDPKLKTFVNKALQVSINKESKQKIEELIDKYNIRKLPQRFDEKIPDIVKVIDANVSRGIRDGLFKLQDLEKVIDNLDVDRIEELVAAINKNLEG